MIFIILRKLTILTLVILLFSGTYSFATDLTGYQAIYNMKLDKATTGSQFSAVHGSAVSYFRRACAGWQAKEELVMDFYTQTGASIRRDLKFESLEAFDGKTYKFSSTAMTNGIAEKYYGTAHSKPEKEGEAGFGGESQKTFILPQGTVFYTGLVQWLLSEAERGRQSAETWVFDGADAEGPEKVVAFILAFQPDRNQDLHPNFGKLTQGKRWTIRLAFYKPGPIDGIPNYEMEIGMVENGVLTGFRIHFENFSVTQTLEDLISVEAEKC